jgi:salicylate hydroxylase
VYALHLYLPRPILRKIPISDRWGAPAVDLVNLMLATRTAEPRLRTLLMMASAASVVAYDAHQALDDEEDWVLPSAPGVLLGDAAHPTPPGSVQASAVALEDAAVFAKLFSHLRRRDQIPSLLSGFAGLRAERARLVLEADAQLIGLFAMPYDATGIAQGRDDAFRALTKAGRKVAGEADGDAASNEQWYQTLMTWAYGLSHPRHLPARADRGCAQTQRTTRMTGG